MSGFTSGEGSFGANLVKSSSAKLGVSAVQLFFRVSQHSKDEQLLRSFIEYFSCGNYYNNRMAGEFMVAKFSDITSKIIPFFLNHPNEGVKAQDFNDFCLIADIVKTKSYLNTEGLDRIGKIRKGMNQGRLTVLEKLDKPVNKNLKPLIIKEDTTGNLKHFPSIKEAEFYFESIDNKINGRTISKYLNTPLSARKPFKRYLFFNPEEL
jgi:hypothetical protein